MGGGNVSQDQTSIICIDLKSFYASVECVERGLNPFKTNLVVADPTRSKSTICLAITPAMKALGIKNRCRIHEIPDCVKYITAMPRMQLYMDYSAKIYGIYLRYVSKEDIHVYSVDECFIDVTNYLQLYHLTAKEMAVKLMQAVMEETGITATAGVGTNLYLAKIAMDIYAKHVQPDENGVRIAELDEMTYRQTMWSHQPLTDFWRVGRGYAKKLEAHGMFTMGDVARMSVCNEDLLYQLFGKNAELLIDHSWGWEPCTIQAVKAYHPSENSLGSGQVLHCPYSAERARLVLREMAEQLALDLVSKKLMTDQIVLTVGYDIENLTDPARRNRYHGPIVKDHYGREVPKHAHGTERLNDYTSSTKKIMGAATALFDRIVNTDLMVRRLNIVAGRVISESEAMTREGEFEQMDLFTDYAAVEARRKQEQAELDRERKMQEVMLTIKNKYGKNAILKGMNLEEGATGKDRNEQIGGHRA